MHAAAQDPKMRLLIHGLPLVPFLLMLLLAPAFLFGPPSRASRVAAGLTSRLTPSRRFVYDIWRRPQLAPLNSHRVNSSAAGISGPPPHLPANAVEPMHAPPPPPASRESASNFLYCKLFIALYCFCTHELGYKILHQCPDTGTCGRVSERDAQVGGYLSPLFDTSNGPD